MTKYCRDVCGQCLACIQADREIAAEAAIYDSLPPEDLDSINRRDPDDPRSFALDHKGRP